jgi:hypothetical protein
MVYIFHKGDVSEQIYVKYILTTYAVVTNINLVKAYRSRDAPTV